MIRTFDMDQINSVLKHPDIWPNIADDEDTESFTPPMGDNCYLFAEGVLFILHPDGNDLEIHANIVPKYREHAYEMGQEALNYGFNELNAERIVARIPTQYGSVYGFALKSGMNDEGLVNGDHFLTLRAEEWGLLEA